MIVSLEERLDRIVQGGETEIFTVQSPQRPSVAPSNHGKPIGRGEKHLSTKPFVDHESTERIARATAQELQGADERARNVIQIWQEGLPQSLLTKRTLAWPDLGSSQAIKVCSARVAICGA